MVTGTQMQTVWALGIRDLVETLETCLAGVKYKGELKLQDPEPLAHGRLLHITIPTRPPPCRPATTALPGLRPTGHPGPCPPAHQASSPQAHWNATCQSIMLLPTRPLNHQPAGPPTCRPARLPKAGLPQEVSSTTRHRLLQTCLGNTDKQDWMLKD
jgi:hypothetical protein